MTPFLYPAVLLALIAGRLWAFCERLERRSAPPGDR